MTGSNWVSESAEIIFACHDLYFGRAIDETRPLIYKLIWVLNQRRLSCKQDYYMSSQLFSDIVNHLYLGLAGIFPLYP